MPSLRASRLPFLFLGLLVLAIMRPGPAGARPATQFSDPVKQGEYLATISGCIGCHTPTDERGDSIPSMQYAGGYVFDLGPLGKLYSKNLTSDRETGLGAWSDEEIKVAIRSGLSRDGLHLFPVMPYRYFNKMAESDLDAIIAFLRTLPPIRNELPRQQLLPDNSLPILAPPAEPIVAPPPSDTAARGRYLMNAVIACGDCHTPIDESTGEPIKELDLAGGQPYEGPWGIIYGGNITNHPKSGIGSWSDAELIQVMREGVRRDGRKVVLMPWREYTVLTDEDMQAIIHYLRNDLPVIDREVPAPSLKADYIEYVTPPTSATPSQSPWLIGGALLGLGVAAVGLVAIRRRRPPNGI